MSIKHDEKITRIDISRVQRVCRSDIAIPVGAEIVIHAIDQGTRFQTTFIGLIKNKYLLVHRPEQQRNSGLTANDRITVRYISGSLVFGFSSTVAATITKPWPIIFIDHPECFETLNLRQDDRIPCFQPVAIFKDGQEMQGKLTDISKSGCRIVIATPAQESAFAGLAAQSEIFCALYLPGNEEQLYTKGLIRQVEKLKNKIRLGVQFVDMEERVHNAIERHVATTLEYLEGV